MIGESDGGGPFAGKYCERRGTHQGRCALQKSDGNLRVTARLRFDDDGNVIAFEEQEGRQEEVILVYAAGHRLTSVREPGPEKQFSTYTYTYDEHGRLVHVAHSGWGEPYEWDYAYDPATGLLATAVSKAISPYPTQMTTTTYDYDAQRRPLHVVDVVEFTRPPSSPPPVIPPVRTETTFVYDCGPGDNFDGANAAMSAFKDRACTCGDPSCTEATKSELWTWRRGLTDETYYADPDPRQKATFDDLVRATEICLARHLPALTASAAPDPLDSAAILSRSPVTQHAKVKYIQLGWAGAHGDDPRGAARARPALEALVQTTLARIKAGSRFEDLMVELSEDHSDTPVNSFDVTTDAAIVPRFKALALRLAVGELGLITTRAGVHIVRRVQ